MTEVSCIDGVKGHVGVSWDQPEVKLLSNAPRTLNLVGRTLDQSVMYCWGKLADRGQLVSTRGHTATKKKIKHLNVSLFGIMPY